MLLDRELHEPDIAGDPILSVDDAIRCAVIYADLFDFPLRRDEVARWLPAVEAPPESVSAAIDRALLNADWLESEGEFLFLVGRRAIVETRLRRLKVAHAKWRRARRYGRILWSMPFVRMVAVTGALAVDNVDESSDIDVLIVTEPGRLWLVRGMAVLLCRLTRPFGEVLCPNYLVTANALEFPQRDLYTAHELSQMRTLHGRETAERLLHQNRWSSQLLPNTHSDLTDIDDRLSPPVALSKSLAAAFLRLPPFDLLERWERERKIGKLAAAANGSGESSFSADICKGHHDGHGERVLRAFAVRLAIRA